MFPVQRAQRDAECRRVRQKRLQLIRQVLVAATGHRLRAVRDRQVSEVRRQRTIGLQSCDHRPLLDGVQAGEPRFEGSCNPGGGEELVGSGRRHAGRDCTVGLDERFERPLAIHVGSDAAAFARPLGQRLEEMRLPAPVRAEDELDVAASRSDERKRLAFDSFQRVPQSRGHPQDGGAVIRRRTQFRKMREQLQWSDIHAAYALSTQMAPSCGPPLPSPSSDGKVTVAPLAMDAMFGGWLHRRSPRSVFHPSRPNRARS